MEINLWFSDQQSIDLYNQAVEYISTSERGKTLLKTLQESPLIFNVVYIDNNKDSYDNSTNTIYWDPYSGLILNTGDVQSAALGLVHEMGHAEQDLNQVYLNPDYDGALIEKENLEKNEIPIAIQLGEPVRLNYFDGIGPQKMNGPTENIFDITADLY